jgi:signal transduction histidine kinase
MRSSSPLPARPPHPLLIVLPLLLFVGLLRFPTWDPIWDASVPHFYIVSFTSFVALVAAIFVASASGRPRDPRTWLVSMAFVAIAAFFLVHGLTTPGILMEGFHPAVGWSARLSLAAGALLFGLAAVPWKPAAEAWLFARQRILTLLGALAYAVYVLGVVAFPEALNRLTSLEPVSNYLLAGAAVAALLASAYGLWRAFRYERPRLASRLALALTWLATAQVSMALGVMWHLSWWWYHVLMLAGFIVALSAMAAEFEALSDFRPARYFAGLGSIVGLGLALLAGEIGASWLSDPAQRSTIVSFAILATGVFFGLLYVIVYRADRLIAERTAALRREQHLRSELTRMLVHDLKNPLASILGSLGPLTEGMVGELNDAQARFLSRAEGAGQEMLRLIEELLDVERLEAGALPLDRGRLDAGELLRRRASEIEGLAQHNRLRLVVEIPDSLPGLEADEGLIDRVVGNLLSNAVKFTPPGGTIRLSARAQDGTLLFEVADSGPGIPAADRARVFEKFARLSGARTRGAGLGLTFCKMVVEAHHGRIEVEGSPEGGALFRVYLPLAAG